MDTNGDTAWTYSVKEGPTEFVQSLLQLYRHRFRNLNHRNHANEDSLVIACKNKDIGTVQLLLATEGIDKTLAISKGYEQYLNDCSTKKGTVETKYKGGDQNVSVNVILRIDN